MATSRTQLTNRIPEIQANMRLKVTRAIRAGAEVIAERARERVPDAPPLNEGLVDSINVWKPPNTTYTYAVVAGDRERGVFYGHMVEFGTSHSAPHPFLIPAAEESMDDVTGLVGEALGEL